MRGVFTEDWVCYLLIKELSDRCPPEWEFDRESSDVDLLICDHAEVELKGPHEVKDPFDKETNRRILKDFETQHARAEENPDLQHFVLLILHAPKEKFYSGFFQRWLDQLESTVREHNPRVRINLKPSKPLVLNGDEPWLMECCLYSVETAVPPARSRELWLLGKWHYCRTALDAVVTVLSTPFHKYGYVY